MQSDLKPKKRERERERERTEKMRKLRRKKTLGRKRKTLMVRVKMN